MICDFHSRNLANLISTAKIVFAKIAFFLFCKVLFSQLHEKKSFFFMQLDAKLQKSFLMKKTAFVVSDLFLYFSVKLYFRLLFCGVYNFLMENTHRKKRKCVSATHEKKKMKTALHDSFVILSLFFIFVSSENPKSSTFTNQACWCNCFFGTFPKKKNSLNLFAMYKF